MVRGGSFSYRSSLSPLVRRSRRCNRAGTRVKTFFLHFRVVTCDVRFIFYVPLEIRGNERRYSANKKKAVREDERRPVRKCIHRSASGIDDEYVSR